MTDTFLAAIINTPESPMASVLAHFSADVAIVARRYSLMESAACRTAQRAFLESWRMRVDGIDFDNLTPAGKIDVILLRRRIEGSLHHLARESAIMDDITSLLPFADTITSLHDASIRGDRLDGRAAADMLDAVQRTATEARIHLVARRDAKEPMPEPVCVARAVARGDRLRSALADWHAHYGGYDPVHNWWAGSPHESAMKAIDDHLAFLRHEVLGESTAADADKPIVGDPLGADVLRTHIAHEYIPYSPEELIAIGERELAWCERQMADAARAMGCITSAEALERVKNDHPVPGSQPDVVRQLANEAIAFLEERGLVTVPALAKETWRLTMITPAQQKMNPFFWGGETIGVSSPHASMAHEEKLMSMRGNNIHFSRATVHHELVPGHHLQGFMAERCNRHRRGYGTPFYVEGWPLYWEMLLWDLGFARTPAQRVGMLFWRMHRAARVVFSLKFHLGQMTVQECITMLTDRVGHEHSNAVAEIRRSVSGDYPPLYQCAYLIGGLQLRALRRELVVPGTMDDRTFHDAILEANNMPVELLRALLAHRPLSRDYAATWLFGDDGQTA